MSRHGIVVIALLTAACASSGGLRQEPLADGKSQVFEAPLTVVVDAAREAVVGSKLSIEEAYQPEDGVWVIMAQNDGSALSWGEMVRVVIVKKEDNPNHTVVRVITRRKGTLNITAKGDYSESIFSGIKLALSTDG